MTRPAIKIALAWCGCAAIALATSIIPMSVEQLSRRATQIVEARAVSAHSEWGNAQHTLVYTFTTFQVERTLKGATQQQITVRQLGGRMGHTGQRAEGVRPWNAGEEALLFLRPSDSGNGVMTVVGLMQGDFRITRAASGEAVTSNGVHGVMSYGAGSSPPQVYSGSSVPLKELEARIQKALQP